MFGNLEPKWDVTLNWCHCRRSLSAG